MSDDQGRANGHEAEAEDREHDDGCIDREHDPNETQCLDAEDVRYLQAVARDPEGAERWS